MSIGVVMIVKDEAHVIERCLKSTQDWAAAWVISDTGSTDGTIDEICKFAVRQPVWLLKHKWEDFATNRNHALDEARRQYPEVDYWLSLDADETATLAEGADDSKLEGDLVFVTMTGGNNRVWAPRLIRAKGPCRWQGRCHEVPEGGLTSERWEGLTLNHVGDGHDSPEGRRLARNEMLLRRDLHDDPDNSRTIAYLGQTLEQGGRKKEAIEFWKRRAAMGTMLDEEGWWAHWRLGVCQLATGDLAGVDTLLRATNRRPWRGEPLADLATYYLQQGCEELGKFFASAADSVPYPTTDRLFIEDALYNKDMRTDTT